MPQLKQIFLRPGRYRISGKMVDVTKANLLSIAKQTMRMLKAGISVPLWGYHTNPGDPDGGPQSSQFSNADARGVLGWMIGVRQLADGSLEQTLDVCDPKAAAAIKEKRIRFTSPEIGEYVDGLGRSFNTVIRHMALTATPRNPSQGPFVPVVQFSVTRTAGKPVQFSLDDRINEQEDETEAEPGWMQGIALVAFVDDLKKLGVQLPADWTYRNGFAVLSSAVSAAANNRSQLDADEEGLTEVPANGVAQFSESEKREIDRLRGQLNRLQAKRFQREADEQLRSAGLLK